MIFSEEIISALESIKDNIRRDVTRRDTLFKFAVKALTHESKVQEALHETLTGSIGHRFRIVREYQIPGSSGRLDIAVLEDDGLIGAIEIKAPMTNHDGIRHKTRRAQGLSRDVEKLRRAKSMGADAIEVFAIFEVYGLVSDGAPEPSSGRSIRQYEKDIRRSYGIKWPTRHDYIPHEGRQEVETACATYGLHIVSSWNRVDLSPIGTNISAYVDLGVFEMG